MLDYLMTKQFINNLPKAELHLHIEGTLEPEMMLAFAKRNGVKIKYDSVKAIKAAYKFANLQQFLDLYFQGISVLVTEDDYFQLTYAYLARAHAENVVATEIFFDPQAHLARGVKFSTFINGMSKAIDKAKIDMEIEASLIMCFLRHLPESDAIKTFEIAMDYRNKFIGVGLDSGEIGNPPINFKQVFRMAGDANLHLVAHAGEEAPAKYIWQALDELGVSRIDHGNNAIHDPELVKRLAKDRIPLTMCPLSNKALNVCPYLSKHPAKQLLDSAVIVTLNSDDPAYFGGYINANYLALADNLNHEDLVKIASNSLESRF